MKLLTPKEIEDLRLQEEELRQSERIAKQKEALKEKYELRRQELDKRLEVYQSRIAKEIKELKKERDLLKNSVERLREEKRDDKRHANKLVTDAQITRLEAHQRLVDAANVEKHVESRIDKLETFRRKKKELEDNED